MSLQSIKKSRLLTYAESASYPRLESKMKVADKNIAMITTVERFSSAFLEKQYIILFFL